MAGEAVRKIFGEIIFRDKATKELDKLNSKMDKSNASAMGLNSALAAIGGTAFLMGAVNVAKEMINVSASFEQTSVAMEVMTGNAETAQKLLKDIEDISIVTPFTPEALTENAKLLLNFGTTVDDIIPSLKMLGDISGGNNDKLNRMTLAFAQVQSQGRLMGQDLLQMINAGFNPLQVISEKTGRSMRDLKDDMSKGLVSFEMVNEAFKTATSEGGKFFGMMEKQSQTWAGLQSTLEGMKGIVFRQIGDILVKALKPVIKIVIQATQAFVEFSKTERGAAVIKTALIALSAVIGTVFVAAVWAAVVAFQALNIALLPITGTILGIAAAITILVLIVDDLITWFQGGESVIGEFFESIWGWIEKSIPGLAEFLRLFGRIVKTVYRFFSDPKFKVKDFAKAIGKLIIDLVASIPGLIWDALKYLGEKATSLLAGLGKNIIKSVLPDSVLKVFGVQTEVAKTTPMKKMADGGTLQKGESALIGEEGPEIFTAGQSGAVSPITNNQSRFSIKSLVGTINIVVQNSNEAVEEIKMKVLQALNELSDNILASELGVAL